MAPSRCSRWRSLPAGDAEDLAEVLDRRAALGIGPGALHVGGGLLDLAGPRVVDGGVEIGGAALRAVFGNGSVEPGELTGAEFIGDVIALCHLLLLGFRFSDQPAVAVG